MLQICQRRPRDLTQSERYRCLARKIAMAKRSNYDIMAGRGQP